MSNDEAPLWRAFGSRSRENRTRSYPTAGTAAFAYTAPSSCCHAVMLEYLNNPETNADKPGIDPLIRFGGVGAAQGPGNHRDRSEPLSRNATGNVGKQLLSGQIENTFLED